MDVDFFAVSLFAVDTGAVLAVSDTAAPGAVDASFAFLVDVAFAVV